MNKSKGKLKKLVIISCIALLTGLFVMLTALPFIIIGPAVTRVEFDEMWHAEDFGLVAQKITVLTDDGLNVVAHKVDATNPRAVIIFIPGIRVPSVTSGFGHAKIMYDNNFSSILLERRARGSSEGDTIGLGYTEYLDVKAVVEHIRIENTEIPIIVYGWSMGAATALISIGELKDISGVVSLAAFSSMEDIFYDVYIKQGVPCFIATMQRPFVSIYTTVKYGTKTLRLSPKAAMDKLGDRPALIVHSKEDSVVPFESFNRIMERAPEHVESWVLEGDRHLILETHQDLLHPQNDPEYINRILNFLNAHW